LTVSKPVYPDPSEQKRPGNRAFLFGCAWAVVAGLSCGPAPAPITIRAGLLLDGRGGTTRDALITVVDGKITSVAPYQAGPVAHDLSGYTVLPGLIDAHVHITGYINRAGRVSSGDNGDTPAEREAGEAANVLATLRAGFTTVASMGSDGDTKLKRAIESGSVPGPRILTSQHPIMDSTLSPRLLRRSVRQHKAMGADFIKIFNSSPVRDGGAPRFSTDQLSALCGEARRRGLRSVVHAHSDASIRGAAAAGCDQVEHGTLSTIEGLRILARQGIDFDPQCGLVLDNYLQNRASLEGMRGFDSAGFALMERLRPEFPRLIRTALAVPGLKILYGSDAVAGAHGKNAEDLVCRVREAGQSPMDALVTATSRNAAVLGLGKEIGTIAPGFQADIIALDGNPLDAIEAVRRVKFVMRKGEVFVKP